MKTSRFILLRYEHIKLICVLNRNRTWDSLVFSGVFCLNPAVFIRGWSLFWEILVSINEVEGELFHLTRHHSETRVSRVDHRPTDQTKLTPVGGENNWSPTWCWRCSDGGWSPLLPTLFTFLTYLLSDWNLHQDPLVECLILKWCVPVDQGGGAKYPDILSYEMIIPPKLHLNLVGQ